MSEPSFNLASCDGPARLKPSGNLAVEPANTEAFGLMAEAARLRQEAGE